MIKYNDMRRMISLSVMTSVLLVAMTMVSPNKSALFQSAAAEDVNLENPHDIKHEALAPIATSGDNVYIVWWSNKTGNDETMFRASADRGETFGDKINLSNSTERSVDAEIAAEGDSVYVTWWEETVDGENESRQPVFRASANNGETFGETFVVTSNTTTGPDNDTE
jgi:hypothetical protein